MHEARLEKNPNRKMNVPLAAKACLVEGKKKGTNDATVRGGTRLPSPVAAERTRCFHVLGNAGQSFSTLQTKAFLWVYADVLASGSLQAQLHDTLKKGGERMKPPDGSSEATVMSSNVRVHL